MSRQDTKFHGRAHVVDARGTLAAMHDLTRGETDGIEIL